MHIEIVSCDLPLERISQIVLRMAEELDGDVRWDGEVFRIEVPPENSEVRNHENRK